MIRVYRNRPRTDPFYRGFGYASIGRIRCLWLGPIFILRTPRS